ncbi:hypothetical protein FACS1894191_0250 [Clostridia bacterium]|nr:hypothetical protein FACS1894191_0250 [Clostridia bacterium]
MSGNFKKEDLRVLKTYKALTSALLTLLGHRCFGKITVYDLCGEALVSRASFYSHFNDKYDLLSHWLTGLREDWLGKCRQYTDERLYSEIDEFIRSHAVILTNLATNADGELMNLLLHVLSPEIQNSSANRILLSNFCGGGLLSLLMWQAKNKFPPESRNMAEYIHKLLCAMIKWDAAQE